MWRAGRDRYGEGNLKEAQCLSSGPPSPARAHFFVFFIGTFLACAVAGVGVGAAWKLFVVDHAPLMLHATWLPVCHMFTHRTRVA